jgi:hypothetical protein
MRAGGSIRRPPLCVAPSEPKKNSLLSGAIKLSNLKCATPGARSGRFAHPRQDCARDVRYSRQKISDLI